VFSFKPRPAVRFRRISLDTFKADGPAVEVKLGDMGHMYNLDRDATFSNSRPTI
jgi:hypothetical protein